MPVTNDISPPTERPEADDAAVSRAAPVDVAPSRLLVGDIRQTVLWLALPVLGEQVLNACVAWNDMLLAGRLGVQATAGVGVASYIAWLMALLFTMVGIGATAIVSRAIGGRRADEARHTTNQAIVIAIGLGALGSVCIWLFSAPLARLMNTSGETARLASRFMSIEATAYVIEAVTFAGAACLRGAGDTRSPMVILGVVNIVNVLASWALAFGAGLGIDGIAWGTVTARCVGGAMMLYLLIRVRSDLTLSVRDLRPDPTLIRRILRIGGPAAVDGGLMWCGHFVFLLIVTRAAGRFSGDTLAAAHMIGIRIESLSYLPAMAWATASATLVGQNLGAGNPARARKCAYEGMRHAVLVLSGTGLLYFAAAPYLYRIFTNDASVIECGTPALRGLGLIQPALAVLIVMMHSLRGAGDTMYPVIFTVIGVMCLRIPVAYIGGVVMKGALLGAWCGMFIDLMVRAALMTLRFRSGRWQRVKV